ncbi:hypothetical protein Misp01_78550 [Microtetraspora sp. NBRC 13810]|uniref:hypothetical protein n=1 Tax=Microtetraspora sp. NBRC 13810 TaxID=3030990 RepID=UPI0024A5A85E|nr:hypothetical protein [Microtetraspora sp. NBRC 13810]GLW12727.1 hypothetical protein Misp01_78550 [Microtetraspora sp. NBRC 13810]
MADKHRVAHDAFVAQLNQLRERAGCPTFTQLHLLSKRGFPGEGTRRELVPSTTNEILHGKRANLPAWAWVVSYLAACKDAATQNQLDVHVDTQRWFAHWRSAQDTTPHPANPRPGDTAPTVPVPVPVPAAGHRPALVEDPYPGERPPAPSPGERPSSAPAGHPCFGGEPRAEERPPGVEHGDLAPALAAAAQDDELSLAQAAQCYLEAHGRTGARLFRWAQDGDGDACLQLFLITLLNGWSHESLQWLERAYEARNPDALLLFQAADRRSAAATIACRYGCAYEADGKVSMAALFHGLANAEAEPADPPEPADQRRGKHSRDETGEETGEEARDDGPDVAYWRTHHRPTLEVGALRFPDDYPPPLGAPLPDDVDLHWPSTVTDLTPPPPTWWRDWPPAPQPRPRASGHPELDPDLRSWFSR